MFLAIISTIFGSISSVFYKKALAVSDIKGTVFQYFGELFFIPVIIVIMAMGFNFRLLIDPIVIGGLVGVTVLFILESNIEQHILKKEKLSVLLPYSKINNFIVIITGFVFFRDSSLASFLICMVAIVLVTATSIDFKNHTFPKNFRKILLLEAIKASELMGTVYILKMLSSVEYAIISQVVYLVVTSIIIWSIGEMSEFKKVTPEFVKYRGGGYTIGIVSFMIDTFLLKEFWVVITTLFGFFGSSLSLALAYFFLKEVPERKEIVLGVVMVILAGTWYYLR